jgi:hypothetical protein
VSDERFERCLAIEVAECRLYMVLWKLHTNGPIIQEHCKRRTEAFFLAYLHGVRGVQPGFNMPAINVLGVWVQRLFGFGNSTFDIPHLVGHMLQL